LDELAKAALRGPWGKMTLEERTGILHKVADGINARFDEFLEAECLDTGKPKSLASHIDIPRGAANFKVFADMIKNVPTESFEMPTPDGTGALNYAVRRPKGLGCSALAPLVWFLAADREVRRHPLGGQASLVLYPPIARKA
jgi:aminomuconate-semialdehyde/2-hydroxymuconate-6-semialdehyde dehydrogenase